MRGRHSIFKRCLALLLVLVTVASMGISAFADSSDRVSLYISLAAGKSTSDGVEGISSLTKDELRFLGVYISNYFVPFGTELGSTDEETTTQNKEDISKSLQTNLKFESSIADSFTETILGLSRSSSKELEFRVSTDYHTGYKEVSSSNVTFTLNYYNFLRLMLGHADEVFSGWLYLQNGLFSSPYGNVTDQGKYTNKCVEGILDGIYKYGYFGYVKDGSFVPMFDCSLDNSIMTPSQYAFYQCLGSVDISNGYGFNIFDFTKDEVKDESVLENLSDEQLYQMSMYGMRICVDCFGNIILKGANHQYIAVPGCMNPYTWVSVKSNGEDLYQAGTCLNIVNFNMLSMADSGKLLRSSKGYGTYEELNGSWGSYTKENGQDLKWGYPSYNALSTQLDNAKEGDDLYLRVVRNSNETNLKDKVLIFNKNTPFSKGIEIAEEKFIEITGGKDFSYYWRGGNQYRPISSEFKVGTTRARVRMLDKFVYIDNLGQYGFDDSSSTSSEYSLINVEHYLDTNGESPRKAFASWGGDSSNGFTNMFKDIQSGKLNTSIQLDDTSAVSIYVAYAFAGLYSDSGKVDTIGKLGYRMNLDNLPEVSKDPIVLDSEVSEDLVEQSIKSWVYYLLHPNKGMSYVRELITNKFNALLVGWHNDMLGTNGVGNNTGTTKYRSQTGYVTTPDLSEIEWTNSMMELYNNVIPFLIVVMLVIMLFAYVSGVLTLQRSVFGVLIFSLFLMLPVNLINGVVGQSNRISQNIYGEKFTYWALVQQESYINAIDSAITSDSYSNYLRTLYAENSKTYSNQGGDSILLKWQTPKKMSSLMLTSSDSDTLDSLKSSTLLGSVLGSSAYSGESYLDGSDNVYMYRSYTDISNFSRYIYASFNSSTGGQPVYKTLTNDRIDNVNDTLKDSIYEMGTVYESDRVSGYTNKNGDGSTLVSGASRVIIPMTSSIYNDALGERGTISELTINDYVGINSDAFNFSLPLFNTNQTAGGSSKDYKEIIVANTGIDSAETKEVRQEEIKKFLSKYSDEDISGLAAYSLMSENVFYYFSWDLYDMGLSTSPNATSGYKNLLLGSDNGGFFYNTLGNGELKDFMDMRSLFTYLIPYLKEGNELVREWDDVYGIFIYDGVPTEEGYWNDPEISSNPELQQKYWHNLNVFRLYSVYCPWVDIMYDCSYAKSETITALGKKYVIEDPLDPASYPDERPMIFSESEMHDYGLERGDLTRVEQLILDCNEGMQDRLYELLNYYNFSDTTLNTAAAMNCAFEFNNTFSESGVFSSNHNIYPQSFELADFSYDAFLRFILSNTTGEELTYRSDGDEDSLDFYGRIVENSSTTTAIIMIILDILSVYVIPTFKIAFIVLIFLASILIVITTAFRTDQEFKFIKRVFVGAVLPMLQYMGVTVGFAFLISLFMGRGNTAVTETKTLSISMGDPVVVMIAMIAINLLVLVLYFLIIRGVFTTIKREGKSAIGFVTGIMSGVTAKISGAISSGFSRGSTGGSSSRGMGGYSSTGSESSRATRRSNKDVEDFDDRKEKGKESTRQNDSRNTISQQKSERLSKEEATKRKDSLNKRTKDGMSNISGGKE